jgi:uncharacterized membrane protein HdeD (DUF308 family)
MSEITEGHRAYNRSRQKFTLVALGLVLIVIGILLIFVLKRAPMPLRIIGGLGDLVAGAVLLVLARQKFGEKG